MISTATMYRKRTETIGNEVATVNVLLRDESKCRLHWIDNYARFLKANCLWYNQDVLKQLLWTAHGFKSLCFDISMTWKLDNKNDPIVAMPHQGSSLFGRGEFLARGTFSNLPVPI